MTNKTKSSAPSNSRNNASALTASTTEAMNSKIEQSMAQYGTYTATSDANNEYPPKATTPNANMTAQSYQSSAANNAMTNQTGASTNAQSSVQTAPQNKSDCQEPTGTLTAQYDANGKP